MQWIGVINDRRNAVPRQKFLQGIAFSRQNCIDVENMRVARRGRGPLERKSVESRRISLGDLPAARIPRIQMRQFNAENCGLQLIQSRIESMQIMMVTLFHTMDTEHSQFFRYQLI